MRGHRDRQARNAERLAVGLGWFSIGLGLAELLAPQSLARTAGLRGDDTTVNTLRALGAREVASGVAILREPRSAARVWSRVGGDAMDLAVLGGAMSSDNVEHRKVATAIGAVVGVTVLDIIAARQLGREDVRAAMGRRAATGGSGVRIEKTVTINRPLHEVYQFWRNFENLPRFMRHLESVTSLDDRRSRWRAKAPAGMTVEWEAEILQDREHEWIAWRSIPGSDIENSGSVRFRPAPGARGTELRVQLQYSPPGGRLGRTIAKLFGEEPEQQIQEDLRRFKQLMETGEIPVSDGPGLRRPAQPAADPEVPRSLVGGHA